MRFNAFIWALYKDSPQGQAALGRCARFADAKVDAAIMNPLFSSIVEADVEEELKEEAKDAWAAQVIRAFEERASQTRVENAEDAFRLYERIVREGITLPDPDEPSETFTTDAAFIVNAIYFVSMGVHLAHPEYFLLASRKCS